MPPLGQPAVNISFAEVDFRDDEVNEAIIVSLTAEGRSDVNLTFMVTPYTFKDYEQFGIPLPNATRNAAQNFDPAECKLIPSRLHCLMHVRYAYALLHAVELDQQDFPFRTQEFTVAASPNIREDIKLSIPINDDNISESSEAFLLVVDTTEETDLLPNAPRIRFNNDGLSVAVIEDDDG